MSDKKLRRLPLAAAAMVACMSAQADYQSPDGSFRLSGFGTLGAVHSSTNDVQFNYPGQGGGAGTPWNTSPDSKLAVQGTYKFTPTVSATAQVMTRYDANSEYVPAVDWIFAKWQALPSLSIRAGRMVTPTFMISDFRNVGYANTTVRPPLDVYGQVPVDQIEGGDVTYQYNLGSITLNGTFFAGNSNADYNSGFRKGATALAPSSFSLKNTRGINITAETEDGLTLRAGYSKAKISISSSSVDALLLSGRCLSAISAGSDPCGAVASVLPAGSISSGTAAELNDLGAQITAQTNALAVVNGRNVSFMGFGFTWDRGDYILSGEYTKRRSDNFISDTTGWYLLGGYRIGKFTPYLGFSRLTLNDVNVTPGTVTPLASNLLTNGIAGQANAGLRSIANIMKQAQRTVTVGSRWDVMPNLALKAQWDQIHKPADSWGLFFAEDPTEAKASSFFNNRRKVNVLTVSMDFVF
jgi:hypothetical protein